MICEDFYFDSLQRDYYNFLQVSNKSFFLRLLISEIVTQC